MIVTHNSFQTMTETSTWTALREPGFRTMRFACVISGICVAAYGTTAICILNMLRYSTLLLSLMSIVSSLPFFLFTLPAGASTK